METITVYYKPIFSGIKIAYHETLVYTNFLGQSFYTSGGPSIPFGEDFPQETSQLIRYLDGTPSLGALTATIALNNCPLCIRRAGISRKNTCNLKILLSGSTI